MTKMGAAFSDARSSLESKLLHINSLPESPWRKPVSDPRAFHTASPLGATDADMLGVHGER
jgi:hypothetical protein